MESTNTTNLLHAARAGSREALEELSIDSGLQLATAFVVLLGMGLVIWELRQTREIAQVQHSQAGIGFFAQSVHSIMGENAAKSIANACDHPDDLTTEEMVVLRLYYTSVINRIRQVRNANLISEDLLPIQWTQFANPNFAEIT